MRLDDEWLLSAVDLINYADPDEGGVRMVLADDLLVRRDRPTLLRTLQTLTEALDDESISNGEWKGLLNRASAKTWGSEYSRVFTPREFLDELKQALENYLRRDDGPR